MKKTHKKNGSRISWLGPTLMITIVSVGIAFATFIKRQQEPQVRTTPVETPRQMTYEQAVAKARLRFIKLIDNHPLPDISHDMRRMIDGDKMRVMNNPEMETGGMAVTSTWAVFQSGKQMPVMNVSTDALLGDQYNDRMIQLILYHEYQHILSLLAGKRIEAPWTEDKVASQFDEEINAYRKECQMAVNLGWENEFEYCRSWKRDGENGLRQIWAKEMSKMPQFKPFSQFINSQLTK